MSNKLLIIDDSESILEALSLLFEDEQLFVLTRRTPIKSVNQAIYAIEEDSPDIILLGHNLDKGREGLEILEILDKTKKTKLLILSTSITVATSQELTETYRREGVNHFPGKNFNDIKKCLHGSCGCYSPLISFLP